MKAKNLSIEKWLNTETEFKLDLNDGSIKFIHFFQMLCPGCIYYGIPQTTEVFNKFQGDKFKVMAVHSVFENHEVMNESALNVFLHEWRLPYPVGIDERKEGEWMPETMKTYHLQGTPSTVVIDGKGEVRLAHFGHMDSERLDTFLKKLIKEQEEL